MTKPIAILGCGPAGLMAAHAVAMSGQDLVILSKPEKSRLGGAQFLHAPIPGITEQQPDRMIMYRKRGDETTYRDKVYGDEYVPFTSFAGVSDGETQAAWNLGEAYDRLWEQYGGHVNEQNVSPHWLTEHIDDFALVFSTVPLPMICKVRAGLEAGFHSFRVQEIALTTEPYVNDIEPDTIVYDGTKDRSWYRASLLFGVHGTEWSCGPPPVPGIIRDRKPIGTTCTCFLDQSVIRLGRRGTWMKGVLTHDAFLGALEVFA